MFYARYLVRGVSRSSMQHMANRYAAWCAIELHAASKDGIDLCAAVRSKSLRASPMRHPCRNALGRGPVSRGASARLSRLVRGDAEDEASVQLPRKGPPRHGTRGRQHPALQSIVRSMQRPRRGMPLHNMPQH